MAVGTREDMKHGGKAPLAHINSKHLRTTNISVVPPTSISTLKPPCMSDQVAPKSRIPQTFHLNDTAICVYIKLAKCIKFGLHFLYHDSSPHLNILF